MAKISIPRETYDQLKTAADRRGVTVDQAAEDTLRRFLEKLRLEP